jgi:hypothetical protein
LSAEARVAATADAWRRKLLDLSKRNRALHFRPTKVSTIAIVDELPAEIFRTLYLRERSMRFPADSLRTGAVVAATALSDWKRARDIRAHAAAVRHAAQSTGGETTAGAAEDVTRWLAWAEEVAARHDPLLPGEEMEVSEDADEVL